MTRKKCIIQSIAAKNGGPGEIMAGLYDYCGYTPVWTELWTELWTLLMARPSLQQGNK